ncbi:MAG: ankyrin repeat domain-containing protein [Verrucomicrobiota bacterium]
MRSPLSLRPLTACGLLAALALAGCSSPEQLAQSELEEKAIPLSFDEAVARAAQGDLETLRLMETAGLDLKLAEDEGGDSALLAAVKANRSETVTYLADRGHDLAVTDAEGNPALHLAIVDGHGEALTTLLAARADLEAANADGDTALLSAIRHDRDNLLAPLLAAGAKLDARNLADLTPLAMAVVKFNAKAVRELLQAGADPMSEIAPDCSALVFATAYGQREIVEALLEAGADANHTEPLPAWHRLSASLAPPPAYGPPRPEDPYLVAVPNHDPAELTAKLLRPRTNLISDGLTATAKPVVNDLTVLALAIRNGDNALTKSLLEKGASAQASPGQRLAPILLAAIEGEREIIQTLVEHGAEIGTADARGQTALGYAVHSGQAGVVAALVEMGADPNGVGVDGQSYLAGAAAKGDPDMVTALIQAGADPNQRLKTPVSSRYLEQVRTKHLRKMLREDYRLTPLMVAASHGDPEVVRALLAGGAKTNQMTAKWKFYPINFAVTQNHLDAMQILLGLEPDASGNQAHVVIDLSRQRATLKENGETVMTSPVSTGKRGHRTPTGEYVITNKHRHWNSTLYGSAMPYFMRLNCGSFGLHVGALPGYPASHGCIRMPWSKAKAFFGKLPLGTRVSIVR